MVIRSYWLPSPSPGGTFSLHLSPGRMLDLIQDDVSIWLHILDEGGGEVFRQFIWLNSDLYTQMSLGEYVGNVTAYGIVYHLFEVP